MEEKIFAEGFNFKKKETDPTWRIGRLSIKIDTAIPFLRQHQKDGWVNLQINVGRSGNPYVELDTFMPKKREADSMEEKSPDKHSEPVVEYDKDEHDIVPPDDEDLPF